MSNTTRAHILLWCICAYAKCGLLEASPYICAYAFPNLVWHRARIYAVYIYAALADILIWFDFWWCCIYIFTSNNVCFYLLKYGSVCAVAGKVNWHTHTNTKNHNVVCCKRCVMCMNSCGDCAVVGYCFASCVAVCLSNVEEWWRYRRVLNLHGYVTKNAHNSRILHLMYIFWEIAQITLKVTHFVWYKC